MLRDKMLAVISELNGEIAERAELIHAIAMALLSGSNLFILGDPGQAKSFAINEFRKRITGTRQFERLLSKQTDEEALFGRLDLASLIPGAVPAQVLAKDPHYQQMKQQLNAIMQTVQTNPGGYCSCGTAETAHRGYGAVPERSVAFDRRHTDDYYQRENSRCTYCVS